MPMPPDQSRRGGALRVTVTTSREGSIRAPGLGAWLAKVAPSRTTGEVSVAIASDALVRRLNRDFRGIDETTDVLSFPAQNDPHSPDRGLPPQHRLLGDIVIAAGVARRQAREAGHSVEAEVRLLCLHGLLHLLGYDHETDQGTMARLERRLRRKGGLATGLLERVEG
jgi:probable rRNA maturation factor